MVLCPREWVTGRFAGGSANKLAQIQEAKNMQQLNSFPYDTDLLCCLELNATCCRKKALQQHLLKLKHAFKSIIERFRNQAFVRPNC